MKKPTRKYLTDPNVWSTAVKQRAREKTIIEPYRKLTGNRSLPENQQYVSMCGFQNGDKCEIQTLTKNKLIKEEQFMGIDRERYIIDFNSLLHPKATWICDNWNSAILKLFRRKNFNPGVINLDTVTTIEGYVGYRMAEFTLNAISSWYKNNKIQHPVYIVINFIRHNPYSHRMQEPDVNLFINRIKGRIENKDLYRKNINWCYSYQISKSFSKMTSYPFMIDKYIGDCQ
jgi:hypothetical protein